MNINTFNTICDDFKNTKVDSIDYIGFIHTLLYVYLRENYRTDDSECTTDMYTSLVDFC